MAAARDFAQTIAFLRAREAETPRGEADEVGRRRWSLRVLLPFGGGALALAVIAAFLLGLPERIGEDEKTPLVPAEYIYLDNHRVDAYVAQLDNGSSAEEVRRSTLSRRAEAKAHGGQVLEVGGSVQQDQFVERVVTRTAADRVIDLRKSLRDDHAGKPIDLRKAESRNGLATLEAGAFVELKNAELEVPTYALPLPKLTYARRANGEDQPEVKRRALTDLLASHAPAVNRYLRALDPDPRIPAVVRTPAPAGMRQTGGADEVTIFVPLRYSKLSDAPGLMAGRVTIFGKVISRVELPEGTPPEERPRHTYFDVETELAFGRALRTAPPVVRDALEIGRSTEAIRVIRETARAVPPGLVVVPLAIFY